MPSSATSPYEVVITFDADTTIGSCHSNCGPISCSGSVCTITYTGSIPMQLFNVKKTDASGDSDRSNIVSVTVNGAEQCSADGGPSAPVETTAPSDGETSVSSEGNTPSDGITTDSAEGTTASAEETSAGPATTAAPPSGKCQCGIKKSSRIVGGTETEVNEYPWIAIWADASGEQQGGCGSTLIS